MTRALTSLLKAARLCAFDKRFRKLAARPWVIGLFCYLLSLLTAYYQHSRVLGLLASEPSSWWTYPYYYLMWLVAGLLLVALCLALTLALVLILSGFFQSEIAKLVLETNGFEVSEDGASIVGEVRRTAMAESLKLLWIVPLACSVFLLGLIPVFTPLALSVGAWLLAYQFLDIVLDTLRIGAGKRLQFALKNKWELLKFGAVLSLVCLIPLVGIFIAPVAVAAAGLYFAPRISRSIIASQSTTASHSTISSSNSFSESSRE